MSLRRFVCALTLFLLACSSDLEGQLASIRALHAEGRHAETLETLSTLLDEYPDDADLNQIYGSALLATGNIGMAVWPLRKAAEDPEHALDAGLLLARALRKGTVPADTIAAIDRVLELSPELIEALLLRASTHLELGQMEEALADCERILALDPTQVLAQLWRIKTLSGLKRYGEATEALAESSTQLLANSPEYNRLAPVLCGTGAEILRAEGDDAGSEQRWQECLEEFPAAPKLIEEAVRFFDSIGKPEAANEALEVAIESNPANLAIRTKLAGRMTSLGRLDDAERILVAGTTVETSAHSSWLALASHYREQGEFAASARAVENVLDAGATLSPVMLAQYVDDLVQTREFERAEAMIEQLDLPGGAELLRGRMLLLQGRPVEAIQHFEAGLKIWPADPTARFLTGQAAEQLGDFDRAIAEYRDAIRNGAGLSDAALRLARLHMAEGYFDEATMVVGHRLRERPRDPEAHELLIQIAGKVGDRRGIAQAATRLSALPGQKARAIAAASRARSIVDGPGPAIKIIEGSQLDLTEPENKAVLRRLVEALSEAGRAEDGLARTQAAIQRDPNETSFVESHALALRAVGESGAAAERLEGILEFQPDRVQALVDLARLRAEQDQTVAALGLYGRAIEANPNDVEAAWNAVELRLASGRDDQLDTRLEALLKEEPIHAGAAARLALRISESGRDLDRAANLAARAVRFGGGADALDVQGRIAIRHGDPEAAVRVFEIALGLRPDSPSTRFRLGHTLARLGRRIEAISALRQALESDDFPEAESARRELARLAELESEG